MHTTPPPTVGLSGAPAIELRNLVKSFRPVRGSADTEVTAVDGEPVCTATATFFHSREAAA